MSGASWMRKLWLPAGLHEITVELDPHASLSAITPAARAAGPSGPVRSPMLVLHARSRPSDTFERRRVPVGRLLQLQFGVGQIFL
jgi:hypothetical protein